MASNAPRRSIPSISRISAVARIGRGAVGIPATVIVDIADQIVEIGVVQNIFVCCHTGTAVTDFILHAVLGRRPAGQQLLPLEYALQRRCAFRELVMAEPALVIENLPAAIRSVVRGFPEIVDRHGTLIGIGKSRLRRRGLRLLPAGGRGCLLCAVWRTAADENAQSEHNYNGCRCNCDFTEARSHGCNSLRFAATLAVFLAMCAVIRSQHQREFWWCRHSASLTQCLPFNGATAQ